MIAAKSCPAGNSPMALPAVRNICLSKSAARLENHVYEPQGKPWTLIPPQGARGIISVLMQDNSTCPNLNFFRGAGHN